MPQLDRIALEWERTFEADDRALAAAGAKPIGLDVAQRRRDLAQERVQTAELLARVARVAGGCSLHGDYPRPPVGSTNFLTITSSSVRSTTDSTASTSCPALTT